MNSARSSVHAFSFSFVLTFNACSRHPYTPSLIAEGRVLEGRELRGSFRKEHVGAPAALASGVGRVLVGLVVETRIARERDT